jgi:presenilin-like A22 family membrane protease
MPRMRTFGLLVLYVGSQLTAIALAAPFLNLGLQTNANPSSLGNILPFIVVIVAAPLLILLFARQAPNTLYLLRYLLLGAIAFALVYTLDPAFSLLLPQTLTLSIGYALDWATPLALMVASLAFLTLLLEPQWYAVDLVGFLAAGSLTAILGISLGILPALVLLGALMVYDAVAVYGTKHMVSLADVVADMKLPILMVVPEERGFDYTRSSPLKQVRERVREAPSERQATFMGLGDVIIPGVLVVSAYTFLPVHPLVLGVGANLVISLITILGSLGGYAVLMRLVDRGSAQAGLPFLNGGAILGFVVAYVALFHSLGLGITWPPF